MIIQTNFIKSQSIDLSIRHFSNFVTDPKSHFLINLHLILLKSAVFRPVQPMQVSTLRHIHIKFSPAKCVFARSSVNYPGHVGSREGISPDPEKVKLVEKFPKARPVKNFCKFSWPCRLLPKICKRFFKNCSTPVALNCLLKKKQKFVWSSACDDAFEILHRILSVLTDSIS